MTSPRTYGVDHRGDISVVHAKGNLSLHGGGTVLRNTIESLLAAGHRKIVLELEDVPYVDSAGLGELVSSYTTITVKGGRLVLVSPTKDVADKLAITQLATVFTFAATVDEAVAELSKG